MHRCHLPVYDEKKCVFFALGRNAMYAACRMLDLKDGDEVLTPAFDCDGSLQPFKALELKLKFFRSDPHTFSADIDDIKRKITYGTKLLHIINHFGMPQDWKALLAFRRESGIPILEDNAYSLFSAIDGRPFGTFGDLSIFSLRKNLPLVDGGMLRINDPAYTVAGFRREAKWLYPAEYREALRIAGKGLGMRALMQLFKSIIKGLESSLVPPPPLYSDPEKGYPPWPLRDIIAEEFSCDYLRPMSGLARSQLNKYTAEHLTDIVNKKRAYYSWLSLRLRNIKGLTVLVPELFKGTAPFCLSFLVDSGRDAMFGVLRKKYDVMAWPTLSRLVLDNLKDYPEVELLGRKIIQVNLPSDRIREPGFSDYLENIVQDISCLAERQSGILEGLNK
jgi:perosamine synthetase